MEIDVQKVNRSLGQLIRDTAEEEMQAIITDVQTSANQRIAVFEADLGMRIEDAVADAMDWAESGKGDSILAGDDFSHGKSIFEEYTQTINAGDFNNTVKTVSEGAKADGDSKYANLQEAEWTAVGLAPYHDPNNIQTLEKLRLQQSASIFQYINYPIARSEIENLKRYVLGQGVKIDCLVEPVLEVIRNFWRVNKIEQRNKMGFRTYLLEGEYFALLFDNHGDKFDPSIDTVLLMRSVPSSEIDEIELDPDDRETRLSFKRLWLLTNNENEERIYLDAFHPYEGDDKLKFPDNPNSVESKNKGEAYKPDEQRLMFFKHGLEYDIRGRVILEPILRWNRVAVDFLYSRARLNHLRSKIYLVETRFVGSGKRQRATSSMQRMPEGGLKLIETPERKFRVIAPQTGADDAETDYKMLLYMIGSAISMPIHILQVNAENENYASIKEAANPFNQAVLDLQDEWGEHLRNLVRYLIAMAVRKKVLKEEYEIEFLSDETIGEVKALVMERLKSGSLASAVLAEAKHIVDAAKKKVKVKTINIPFSLIFPNLIQSDPTKQAQAVKIYIELGLMSNYTARLKIGLDPDVEESRINMEFESNLKKRAMEFKMRDNGAPDADDDAPPNDDDKDDEDSEEAFALEAEAAIEDGELVEVVKGQNGKFAVFSKSGKRLSIWYKTKKAATTRLGQIEFFKNKG